MKLQKGLPEARRDRFPESWRAGLAAAFLGLCAPLLGLAQGSAEFNPDAYVQVEVIVFTIEASAGASNRTGVRPEVLERNDPRVFPSGLVSIKQAFMRESWDASWFDDEWSILAPNLQDEWPLTELPVEVEIAVESETALEAGESATAVETAETVETTEPTESTESAEPPPEPSLWERYRDWYTDLMANCFSQLDREDWHLARALASLERSNVHRVLMHGAWIQPISARARPVLLSSGDAGDAGEVGVLSLTRSGFVSAEVHLWRPLGEGYAELHDLRPMRTRRAYYFDHPLMGIIVRVDPIRVPSEFR